MTCTDCEHHVAAALEGAGAGQVSADFRRGLARFSWPAGVSEAALREAVTGAGYAPGTLRTVSRGAPAPSGEGGAGYDLLVLGAGSAAFAAAIRGRDAGGDVREHRVRAVEGAAGRRGGLLGGGSPAVRRGARLGGPGGPGRAGGAEGRAGGRDAAGEVRRPGGGLRVRGPARSCIFHRPGDRGGGRA